MKLLSSPVMPPLLPARTVTNPSIGVDGNLTLDHISCMDALAYLKQLPDQSVNCIVTSPPYFGLRDYGVDGQIGLEPTPQAFVTKLLPIFNEARRVLRDDGTLWLNLGDTYSNAGKWGGSVGYNNKQSTNTGSIRRTARNTKDIGLGEKQLLGVPWRVAFALQDDGWVLRSDIIWHKPDVFPESVKDRPTKAHEYVFLFTKSPRYWYDSNAVKEPLTDGSDVAYRASLRQNKQYDVKQPYQTNFPKTFDLEGRNRRSVWSIPTSRNQHAHFATMPYQLAEICILAGCPEGGIVLDPFMGSGTTARVAKKHNRHFIGCDLNPDYVALANRLLAEQFAAPLFDFAAAPPTPAAVQYALDFSRTSGE